TLGSTGTLQLDLTGSGIDSLDITGTATLTGEIAVGLEDGFTPADGTQYTILSAAGGIATALGSLDFGTGLPSGFTASYNDAMTDLMVEAQVAPREKFTTIYSGMEVEPFLESGKWRDEMRARLGYQPHHVVVGKIARLFHLKGHEYVLAAAQKVIDAVPNVRFLWIGDGMLHDSYVEQIEAAGLSDYFQLVGLVPPSDIPRYAGAIDILAHTSLREGLARALPQALLAGKPAVSFDVDGAREVVVTGETGELVPPKDVAALTASLIHLASDAPLRHRLGETGRSRTSQVFPHRHMTAEIRKTYLKTLAKKS
ncbi:MAG: glycosyltransferase, partial [Blastopirellula sp. JB062]